MHGNGRGANAWQQRDNGVRRTREPSGFLADEIEYKSVTNVIDTSALASIGLNIGDSTYEWNSFLSKPVKSLILLAFFMAKKRLTISYFVLL